MWQNSFTSYTAIMGINLVIVGNYTRAWNWFTIISYMAHIGFYFPFFILAYHLVGDNQFENFTHIKFWLILLLNTVVGSFPFLLYRRLHVLYFPYLIDLLVTKKIDEEEIEEKLKIEHQD